MSTLCTTRILCGISLAAAFSATTLAGSDCCFANGTPGCDDAACEELVCQIDPFCCDTSWDSICASTAGDICSDICGGSGGTCPPSDHDCFTTGGPGCTDVECCLLVCAADPFCCDVSWDGLCVNGANNLCGGGGGCPPSDHDCFTTGGPGCTDEECCLAVCAFDPFCCQVAWDGLCVNGAFSTCDVPPCDLECPEGALQENEPCGADTNGGCNAPVVGDSDCCTPNPFPGCDDLDCTFAVCAVDPFCCDVSWDGLCSGAALSLCPDLCQLGAGAFEPIACGDTICGTAWAVGGTRDTDWFELVLEQATEITFTVSAKFPSVIGVVNTGGIPDCSLAGALNPFATAGPCGTATITACLGAGTHWLFVAVNGFDGWPCGENSDYVATVTCGGECVPPACGVEGSGDCFVANGSPFCDDEECCLLVCSFDPFCCDVTWDGLCADGALNACVTCDIECPNGALQENEPCGADTNGGCNAPIIGDSDCCTPNPFPGCDDLDCTFAVCAIDPFCCDVSWDGLCSGAALSLCSDICQIGKGAFEPIACGDTICGTAWATGGTRDTDWYEITVEVPTQITFTGTANFPLVIGLVNTGGIPDCGLAGALNPFATAPSCQTASFTACLVPGTHWLFVAVNAFDGFPCGTSNDYVISLECGDECVAPGCGVAGTGSCFVSNGSPFCDDLECCLLICAQDPFCCDVTWDGICASAATAQCGAEPLENDNCEDRIVITDGNTAFSTIGATTDGPPLPPECEEGFGLSLVNDVWYNYTPTCDGLITVSTCSSADFDTRLAAYTGDCDALTLVACNDDGPGCANFTSIMTWQGVCGVTYKIRVGGFGGSGTGILSVSCDGEPCAGEPCPWDLTGDGQVDGADLGVLLQNWGNPYDGSDLGELLNAWGPCP